MLKKLLSGYDGKLMRRNWEAGGGERKTRRVCAMNGKLVICVPFDGISMMMRRPESITNESKILAIHVLREKHRYSNPNTLEIACVRPKEKSI